MMNCLLFQHFFVLKPNFGQLNIFVCCLFYFFSSFCAFAQEVDHNEKSYHYIPLNRQKGTPSAIVSIILKNTRDKYNFKGIPINIDTYRIQEICFNRAQKNYEKYRKGELTEKEYQNESISNRDTIIICENTYNHTVHVLVGFDLTGKKIVIFDKDQNLDFSNEHAFEFDTTYVSLSQEAKEKKTEVLPEIDLNYEHFDGEKIQTHTAYFQFDPYRMIRVNRGKEEIDRLLELRIIQNEYLDGTFTFNGAKYKVMVTQKPPASATYLNSHVKTRITNQLLSFSGKNMLDRGDTILLDGHQMVILGPSMYGDSLKILDMGRVDRPFGSRLGFYSRDMLFLYLDGTSQSLSSILTKENYVILDFWGTWCQPCIKKIPDIQDLYGKIIKLKNIEMVSVAYDEDLEKVHKFVNQYNMTWPNAFDDSSLKGNHLSPVRQLNVTGFPSFFLIQPDGKIISTNFEEISKWIDTKLLEK